MSLETAFSVVNQLSSHLYCCVVLKSPPAQSIDDVLTTSNGTTFYILVEPGEHGLPESPESVKSMKTCMTFLTDTQGITKLH